MDATRVAERFLLSGYRAPAGDLAGVRTVVEEKPAKGIDRPLGDSIEHPPGESPKSDRARALPQRTDNDRDLTIDLPGPPVYNTPGPAVDPKDPPSPNPESKFKMRTPGTPGEEYGHPYKENVYPRRTAGGMFPTYSERQRKNKGDAKRYYQKYYRRRKNRIETRAKRRYNRIRNQPSFKRRQKLRNDSQYKNRFRRLPSGGAYSVAELSRRQREKKGSGLPLSFYHEVWGWGDLLSFEDEGLLVHFDGEGEEGEGTEIVSLADFLRGMVFDSEEDLGAFFEGLDRAYGEPDPQVVVASFYREVFRAPANLDPGHGSQDSGLPSQTSPLEDLEYPNYRHDRRAPGHKLEVQEMHGAPGSAKVIPSGHDFANKEAALRIASAIRVAKKLSELLGETSSDVLSKAGKIKPKGKRFDKKNSLYTFSVPGQTSANTYTVQMKVIRVGNATKLGKMNLMVSCSCPFWQWQGPEHWASAGSYLYGKPRGTASTPSIRDPKSVHKVCKHVAAVLNMTKDWTLP